MLGNAISPDDWCAAHKATLFFHCTPEQLQQSLLTLSELCSPLLHEPMSTVNMMESARRQECGRCGSRNKEHVCPFIVGHVPILQHQQQQQQLKQQSMPPPAAAAAPKVSVKGAAAKPAVKAASRFAGMCGEWKRFASCNRVGCKQLHLEGWIPPPSGCCRDFYFGSCQRPEGKCTFRHVSLEDVQATQQAAASGSSAQTKAPPAVIPKKTTTHAGQRQPSSNRFEPLAASAAAAPVTPRKVQQSSLASLASPVQRSTSSPSVSAAAASTSRPPSRRGSVAKNLASDLGAAASLPASSSAAADDGSLFEKQRPRGRKRGASSPQTQEVGRRRAPQPQRTQRTQPQQQQQQQQQQQHQQEELEEGELRASADAEQMDC